MVVFLWVAGVILVAGVMGATTYIFTVGGLGVATDSRYERCPRCGHHALVHDGSVHDHGCPPERHPVIHAHIHSAVTRHRTAA